MTTKTQQPVGRQISAEYIELLAHRAGIATVTPEIALFAEIINRAERAARIEAQQRLADAQELAAKSGLAHRMAVQEAVSDAMKRMQAGEKLSYTDKDVELIMLGWQSELQKAVDAERDACALICYKNWQSVSGDEIRARGTP